MKKFPLRLLSLVPVLLLCGACHQSPTAVPVAPASLPTLPAISTLSLERYSPAVRTEIQKAWDEARAKPNDAKASGTLGMILHVNDLFELALPCYERAKWLEPDAAKWNYYLGLTQGRAGKPQEAIASLRACLKLRADYAPAKRALADALLDAGETKESKNIYADLVKQSPNSAPNNYGMGRVQMTSGQWDNAITSFTKACAEAPEYGAAHYALAQALRRRGREAETAAHLAAYKANKDVRPAVEDPYMDELLEHKQSAEYYGQRGLSFAKAGRFKESAQLYERALGIAPNDVQSHVILIGVYDKLQQDSLVEQHYRTALRLAPKRVMAHFYYGEFSLRRGRKAVALQAFRKAEAIDPHQPGVLNNIGLLLQEQKKWQEAERYFRRALDSQPGSHPTLFNLGRLLVEQRKFEQGLPYLEKTLTPPDELKPTYLISLAITYEKWKKYPRAVAYAENAKKEAERLGQTQLATDIATYISRLQNAPAQ